MILMIHETNVVHASGKTVDFVLGRGVCSIDGLYFMRAKTRKRLHLVV